MENITVIIRDAELKGIAAKLFIKTRAKELEKGGNPLKKGIIVNMLLTELAEIKKIK